MSEIIGYCFIYAVLFLFFGGIFLLYSKLRIHKVKRELDIEKFNKIYNIALENIFLLGRLERDEERSKQYPLMMEYLQQNRAIAKTPFTFDHLEFNKRDRIKTKSYFDEFSSCKDEEIRNAVKSTSDILETVYRQKHPVRAAFIRIKKKVMLRILSLAILVCDILIRLLEILEKLLNLDENSDKYDNKKCKLNENAPEAIKMEYTPKIRMQVA